ncbi:hypothetical protein ABT024_06925 [Streptomyces sp. NPDC002812]|uniref:hypothetical protein n=1 Tax=Streptomyces sp. NPDC002812 TaxID=3154434 RepID=UPI00332DB715
MEHWLNFWRALWIGSSRISATIGGWLAGGLVPRLLAVVLAAGFAKGLPWTGRIVSVAAAGWVVTALALGYRTPVDGTGGKAEEGPVLAPVLVARALHQVAAPNAQLQPTADVLGVPVPTLRRALQEMGVPVARGVRQKGRRVSTGVKAADLPALPAVDAVAMEGVLTSNNNTGNTSTDPSHKGFVGPYSFRVVDDPANPVRADVIHT